MHPGVQKREKKESGNPTLSREERKPLSALKKNSSEIMKPSPGQVYRA